MSNTLFEMNVYVLTYMSVYKVVYFVYISKQQCISMYTFIKYTCYRQTSGLRKGFFLGAELLYESHCL